ncbi:MAG TPA: RNA polymerase sigma factor [Ktedonobacteraceae bacterium]|nr:RNA polymerase sigma factor [Ktedonobacteraceae bacterium]
MLTSVDVGETALLVQNAQVGNTEAFAMLFERYEREIYSYMVIKLGDREEAHDFVQQVFFKAWLNLTTLQNLAYFRAWLYSIARNMMCDYWRGKKPLCLSWEELDSNNDDPGVAGPEEHAAELEFIHLALLELTPKLRACLVLRFVYGYYPCEIACMLGIHVSSVGTYISKARRQLHAIFERLKEEGCEFRAG